MEHMVSLNGRLGGFPAGPCYQQVIVEGQLVHSLREIYFFFAKYNSKNSGPGFRKVVDKYSIFFTSKTFRKKRRTKYYVFTEEKPKTLC